MSERIAAISLKIPDNEAYTTLTALKRLGVDVARVERSEIWRLDDDDDADSFSHRVERNETIFNPNKHRLTVLPDSAPRTGEVWIATLPQGGSGDEIREHLGGRPIAGVTRAERYVGWRLFDDRGNPVEPTTVAAAVERLLCNPAIEKALI
jgi:phosphoribosylformylglycinamidine (FGAM) synthase PurS component